LSIKLFAGKKIPGSELAIMSIMTPKGLVAAVLASIPMQQNLAFGDKIMDLGYSIVLLSIVICSVLVIILSKDPLFIKKVVSRKHIESSAESGIESKQIKK
jgi:cell volume regulation protein A